MHSYSPEPNLLSQIMDWCVYILKCGDDTLYTGITNNLEARTMAHQEGRGAKYTKTRAPFTLVYQEPCADRSSASRREYEIKSLTRDQKLKLCDG